ncbi:MAG: LysR family transcriptional regulator [Pseudomonadota bacterium]
MTKRAQVGSEDIAIVLAVVDHGSVSAAARSLGLNHATVLRRIADFETRTGVRMFDKTTRGYQVCPDRADMIEVMRDAMEGMGAVDRLLDQARPKLQAGLRLTTTDTLAHYVLPQVLPGLIRTMDAPIEVTVDNAHVDFARMQAHLTVRPAMTLPPELSALPAGQIRFAVFGPLESDVPWLGLTGPLARTKAATWVRAQPGRIVAYGDSFMALAAMAGQGMGRTVLPTYVGAATPNVTCLATPKDLPKVPVWVGSHADFGRSRRVLQARKALAGALKVLPQLA